MAGGVFLLGCVLALGGRILASQGINEKPCDELFSVAVPDGQVLADNSLLGTNGIIYPPGHYWSVVVNGTKEFIGCPCLANPCFRKCCGAGMALSETEGGTCISSEEPFHFVLYDLATSKILNSDDLNFTLLYGHTCKYGKYLLEPEKSASDQYFLLPDGTLYVPAQQNITMNPTQFCLDMLVNNSQVVPAICFPPDDPGDQQQFILYPVGMLISEPFLLATFLVYALIVELRNLHGLCLMSYLCGLFIAYFFLAIVQLSDEYSSGFCTTMDARLPHLCDARLGLFYLLSSRVGDKHVLSQS
uniref:Methuselah N-terminal domain-containing protein n=1 Tax=Timema cristinae TaxID=61476 RepID=A0A7R9D4A9_TIMCR|nr:unnamed protein product [Timema cristinae]